MSNEFTKLLINTEKIDKNFFAFEMEPERIHTFEHNDLINDWHIERIRRFNASAALLIHTLQRVEVYGQLVADGHESVVQDGILINPVVEHRNACRDACINIDIYVEKIKSFCRYYFFMDQKATDNGKAWREALMEYKDIQGWAYIQDFLNCCKTLLEDKDAKFLIGIRNGEIHNESPLELIEYKFEDSILVPIPQKYVIDNGVLHNQIAHTISIMIPVTSALQKILENIPPASIYSYLKTRDGKLKNIKKMSDRYKDERIRFQSYRPKSM